MLKLKIRQNSVFYAYAVNTMKSVMTDQVFNIKVETENGNYVGEASHVLVLLTNYFADKKFLKKTRTAMLIF